MPCHEDLWVSGGIVLCIINLCTSWWVVVQFCVLANLPLEKRATFMQCRGGWSSPRAAADMVKRKISTSVGNESPFP
jgi:hypothetical protein